MKSTSSRCREALQPVVKAGSTVGSGCYVTPKIPDAVQPCPATAGSPPPGLAELDKKVLCNVFCCCLKFPNVGADSEYDLHQSCVHDTLATADASMNWKSRYKAEISYAMRSKKGGPKAPYPLMHRAKVKGQTVDTTQPSEYWQGRTEEIPGYTPGSGDVRRPDVVIVRDPSKPPTTDNIDRIVEMKFPGDPTDREQLAAYGRIAGSRGKVVQYDEDECGCKDEKKKKPELEWKHILEGIGALLLLLLMRRFIPEIEELPLPEPAINPGIA